VWADCGHAGCHIAYRHTYTHTYVHTYVHTYIRAYIHTYIHTCIWPRRVSPRPLRTRARLQPRTPTLAAQRLPFNPPPRVCRSPRRDTPIKVPARAPPPLAPRSPPPGRPRWRRMATPRAWFRRRCSLLAGERSCPRRGRRRGAGTALPSSQREI